MRTLPVALLTGLLLSVALSACASSSSSRSGGSTDLITQEEISSLSVSSAHDAVRRLRPRWLQGRGSQSIQTSGVQLPVVFVDEVRFGPIESLQGIQTSDISSMRFINARDATTRFGTGYPAGIIDVTTRR